MKLLNWYLVARTAVRAEPVETLRCLALLAACSLLTVSTWAQRALPGQMPIRTGLTTVGLPGSPIGHDKRDPSLAEILKARGYRTAHFGKNHLGDRDEHLPHQHGFDEFFGNLYHLNSEEEPFSGTTRPRAWPATSPVA
jgi:arylsulfatase A-like enzyme